MSTKLISLQCECLEKSLNITSRTQDFLDFLEKEKIITFGDRTDFKNTAHNVRYEQIIIKLNNALKSGKIQMFEIEWKILPIEHIEISIVCDYTRWDLKWPG